MYEKENNKISAKNRYDQNQNLENIENQKILFYIVMKFQMTH